MTGDTSDRIARLRAFADRYGFTAPVAVGSDGAYPLDGLQPRTGLYIWLSSTGEAYIGQSIDVSRRLREHQRVHRDVMTAAFLQLPAQALNREEARLVPLLEATLPVRNIKYAARSVARVPYDDAIPRRLAVPTDLPDLARKAEARWRRFRVAPDAGWIIDTARRYAENAFTFPWETEGRFWSATVFVEGAVRINCGQQEVFTAGRDALGRPLVRLLCDRSLDWWPKLRFYKTRSWEHRWRPERFNRFSQWSDVQAFNEHLMRHTTALNARSHCPQLFR